MASSKPANEKVAKNPRPEEIVELVNKSLVQQ